MSHQFKIDGQVMSPIANKEDFLNGEQQVQYPVKGWVVPAKMSMLQDANGYCVEDFDGDIYVISIGAVSRFGWDKLGLPESDAYKQHLQARLAKYGYKEV